MIEHLKNFKMNVGEVRIAEDKDFERLKNYLTDNEDSWSMQYNKGDTKVWTKAPPPEQNINFKLIKVLHGKIPLIKLF